MLIVLVEVGYMDLQEGYSIVGKQKTFEEKEMNTNFGEVMKK